MYTHEIAYLRGRWIWEVLGTSCDVVCSGQATTDVEAHADALAWIKNLGPYIVGLTNLYTQLQDTRKKGNNPLYSEFAEGIYQFSPDLALIPIYTLSAWKPSHLLSLTTVHVPFEMPVPYGCPDPNMFREVGYRLAAHIVATLPLEYFAIPSARVLQQVTPPLIEPDLPAPSRLVLKWRYRIVPAEERTPMSP